MDSSLADSSRDGKELDRTANLTLSLKDLFFSGLRSASLWQEGLPIFLGIGLFSVADMWNLAA